MEGSQKNGSDPGLFDLKKLKIGILILLSFVLGYHFNTVTRKDLYDYGNAYVVQIGKQYNEIKKYVVQAEYEPSCLSPRNHVIFLKTYKTGSETIASIVRRYGLLHNLSSVISEAPGGHLYTVDDRGKLDLYTMKPFTPNERTVIGFGKSNATYDLISNHMTWKLGEPEFVKHYMPVDSFKFSIIRDPVTHLTSSWKYFFNTQSYMPPSEKADILVKRLNKPEEFYNQLRNDTYLPHYRFYLRSQLFSFVGEPEIFDRNLSKEKIAEYIKQIDLDFHIILIMEYYDYGLALLSYELCWTPYQMANLEVNVARQTHAELKEYHEEIVRLINYPEFMLYDYFNITFWEKVNEIGIDKIKTRAAKIIEESRKLEEECVLAWQEAMLWNHQHTEVPILNPDRNSSERCIYSTLVAANLSAVVQENQKKLSSTWD